MKCGRRWRASGVGSEVGGGGGGARGSTVGGAEVGEVRGSDEATGRDGIEWQGDPEPAGRAVRLGRRSKRRRLSEQAQHSAAAAASPESPTSQGHPTKTELDLLRRCMRERHGNRLSSKREDCQRISQKVENQAGKNRKNRGKKTTPTPLSNHPSHTHRTHRPRTRRSSSCTSAWPPSACVSFPNRKGEVSSASSADPSARSQHESDSRPVLDHRRVRLILSDLKLLEVRVVAVGASMRSERQRLDGRLVEAGPRTGETEWK